MAKNPQQSKYFNFLLFLLCFFILFLLFRWVHFLLNRNYLQLGTYLESFTSLDNTNTDTNTDTDSNAFVNNSYKVNYMHSNTIDLPAMSKYTCNNWCGPQSQCLLSREQCFSDVDCKRCQDLTALNNFHEKSSTDLGQSYMKEFTKDYPEGATEDILCGIQNCNNSFSRFDKRD